jgi:hypothetical protein
MKTITTIFLLLLITRLQAQDLRQFTGEEKITHSKNTKGIIGIWKTGVTEIGIAEPQLKPKQAELENIYNGLFGKAQWEFATDMNFAIKTFTNSKETIEKGTYTINAQFLTLYLSGKTHRCLMKVEDDGKVIIHFPITDKSVFGIQLVKL